MGNSSNHNFALNLAVILSGAKDLAHEAQDTLDKKSDPTSYERFLPSYLQWNQIYPTEKSNQIAGSE